MASGLRNTGIRFIGETHWSTHFCQFYQSSQDLLDVLVPYMAEGLTHNEFCVWVTSSPLSVEIATEAMRATVADFDARLANGQIEIFPHTEWYMKDGHFDFNRVLGGWIDKHNLAVGIGYDGIRVTGNTAWLEKEDWKSFSEYEHMIEQVIGGYRMLVLCTYDLGRCSADEIIDVVANHQFALVKRKGDWELIESGERRRTREKLERSAGKLTLLSEAAGLLLSSEMPERIVQSICGKVMEFLDCQVFLNYLVIPGREQMHLNAWAGIPEDTANSIEYLDFGVTVCGCVARDGQRIIAEDIANAPDERTGLASSFGIRAYACHPLIFQDRTIGTLSFGATNRASFNDEELEIIQSVATLAAAAMARQHTTQALQRQADLIDLSPDAILVRQMDGTITFWSKGAENLYGWTGREAIGKITDQLFQTRFPEPPDQIIQKIEQEGQWSGELVHVARDGREVVVQSRLLAKRSKNGQIMELLESNIDITERKKTEEALRSTGDYLGKLLDYANAPIIVWDPSYQITQFNHAFERLSGYGADQVIGGKLEMLFPRLSRVESLQEIDRTLAGEFWESVEIPILRQDGEVRVALWNSANIYAEDGKTLLSTIAQGQDITLRKQAQEELQQTLEKLERSNQELQQFAYVASHDLQEPLRMIASFLQLLQRRYQSRLDDEADEFIGFAVDGANRLQKMINDLLLYSRVGTRGAEFAPVSAEETLAQVTGGLRLTIEENQAAITHDPLPTVWADSSQLSQLLQNLLANAIKFHGKEPPRVHISAARQDSRWIFAVKDNGIGIETDYHDKIFVIFQRLDGRRYAGTGIGLAVCKRIVERHNGRIWIESGPGQGSTFYFTLPAEREAQAVQA